MKAQGAAGSGWSTAPSALLIRRYKQFLAAIIVQAVRDGDDEWLCSDDCQALIDLIGLDVRASRYQVDLDRRAVSHAFHKILTADYRYPPSEPAVLRRKQGRAPGGRDDAG
jgi:hypothetical protein